jgi:hypothetical protein
MNANMVYRALDVVSRKSWVNSLADQAGSALRRINPGYQTGRARLAWASRVTEGIRPAHLQIRFAEGLEIDHFSLAKVRAIFTLVQGGEVSVIAGEETTPPKVEFVGEAMRVTLTRGFLAESSVEEIKDKIGQEVQRMLLKKRKILEILGLGHDEANVVENIKAAGEMLADYLWLMERKDLRDGIIELRRRIYIGFFESVYTLQETLRSGNYRNYADFINRFDDQALERCYQALLSLNQALKELDQQIVILERKNFGKVVVPHPAIKGETLELDIDNWIQRIKPSLAIGRDMTAGIIDSVEGRTAFDLVDLRERLQEYSKTIKMAEVEFVDHLGVAPLARVNWPRLLRLLDNLIKDAAQAMIATGGKRGKITLFASIRDGKVKLIIQDTGPAGIPPRVLEEVVDYRGQPVQQIFTPGVRRLEEDTQVNLASCRGLGKLIVRTVAQEIGGRVRAGNIPVGEGKMGGEFVFEF